MHYVIIKPKDLLKRLEKTHGKKGKILHSYLWVTTKGKCWETRGLKNEDHLSIAAHKYKDAVRNFTSYLNNWEPISRALKLK